MAVMLEKLYRALRAAEVPEDQATAAAAELAEYQGRFVDIDLRFAKVDGELRLHRWILSFNTGLLVGVLLVLLNLMRMVGTLGAR